MKVGDLVKIHKKGLSLRIAQKVGGKIGVILSLKQYGPNLQTLVLVGNETFFFVPKYIEVINESR